MLYSLDIIKNNGFECTWDTLYVGRNLKFITIDVVQKYAIDYLSQNEDIDDLNKIELAWDLPEVKVDDLLFLIAKLEEYDDKGYSKSLEKEYRKWRYCVLKEICNNAKNEEQLFMGVEDIFSLYECPDDMCEFFRKYSNIFYYRIDYGFSLKNLVSNFLRIERLDID